MPVKKRFVLEYWSARTGEWFTSPADSETAAELLAKPDQVDRLSRGGNVRVCDRRGNSFVFRFATIEVRTPDDKRIQRCRSCGAQIIWFATASGRPIPIDAQGVRIDDPDYVSTRHVPHFKTCPQGRQWRGRSRKG